MTERSFNITNEMVDDAATVIAESLKYRLETKGRHSHASLHESLGLIEEELFELIVEIHAKNSEKAILEAIDIATASAFLFISEKYRDPKSDKSPKSILGDD